MDVSIQTEYHSDPASSNMSSISQEDQQLEPGENVNSNRKFLPLLIRPAPIATEEITRLPGTGPPTDLLNSKRKRLLSRQFAEDFSDFSLNPSHGLLYNNHPLATATASAPYHRSSICTPQHHSALSRQKSEDVGRRQQIVGRSHSFTRNNSISGSASSLPRLSIAEGYNGRRASGPYGCYLIHPNQMADLYAISSPPSSRILPDFLIQRHLSTTLSIHSPISRHDSIRSAKSISGQGSRSNSYTLHNIPMHALPPKEQRHKKVGYAVVICTSLLLAIAVLIIMLTLQYSATIDGRVRKENEEILKHINSPNFSNITGHPYPFDQMNNTFITDGGGENMNVHGGGYNQSAFISPLNSTPPSNSSLSSTLKNNLESSLHSDEETEASSHSGSRETVHEHGNEDEGEDENPYNDHLYQNNNDAKLHDDLLTKIIR